MERKTADLVKTLESAADFAGLGALVTGAGGAVAAAQLESGVLQAMLVFYGLAGAFGVYLLSLLMRAAAHAIELLDRGPQKDEAEADE
jgi:hypothetical protein